MLKEMPLLRAPEKRRTGMEIKPKVRYPDQTEAAIVSSPKGNRRVARKLVSLDYTETLMHEPDYGNPKWKPEEVGYERRPHNMSWLHIGFAMTRT